MRHRFIAYDDLLSGGYERRVARDQVREEVERVLDSWG
ncbi:MAG: DUF2293 domain-containing protein [Calditrichaeota bacterium]|nr:DUF2293 domain-containing protein [Calditrichota bacterium]